MGPPNKSAPALSGRFAHVSSYAMTFAVFLAVGLARGPGRDFWLPAALWSFHFARRTLESAFLHRYTRRVPLADMAGEYLYYWGFAAWIAWSVASPAFRLPALPLTAAGTSLFALAEAGNFRSHQILARLRPSQGDAARRIPRGFLFALVSCPHYFFEILSWVGFTLATPALGSLAFTLLGAGILVAWATRKQRAYLREFDGRDGRESYPKERRILVPFCY